VTCTTCTQTCDLCPCGPHTHTKLIFCVSHTLSHGMVQCVYGEKGVHETLSNRLCGLDAGKTVTHIC